jgi:hypothetical protein
VSGPVASLPARILSGLGRLAYRTLVLPLTFVYLAVLGAGLAALAYGAIRALLGAAGLIEGSAFDWLPE